MLTLLTLAQSPPVRVVVSVGTDWLTTGIAVAGFVLALASLGWQFYVWKGAGSRVVVETKIALFPAHAAASTLSIMQSQLGGLLAPPSPALASIPSSLRVDASPDLLKGLGPAYPGVMLVAEIQNRGRMPITVDDCIWQVGENKIATHPQPPPGASFPHRLGEHDQCLYLIELRSVISLVDAPLGDPAVKKSRKVWPVVRLGNGRTVRGTTVTVPAPTPSADQTQDPADGAAADAQQT